MQLIRKKIDDRIWELDLIRGIALILMIYFHIIFDLADIFNFKISYTGGVNYFIGKISAILFIFVSGISATLSNNNLKRGFQVFAVAMVITVVTHLAGNDLGIKFGILHLLGLCMIMYGLLKRINSSSLIFGGLIIIAAGLYFGSLSLKHDYLFLFNLISTKFSSSDYYPLFPWMGVFLFGIAAGRYVYDEKRSLFKVNIRDNSLLFAGRNTLIIYLVHQPLILLILTQLIKTK